MTTPRRTLWIGPASADLRARAIEHREADGDGLWIVATPLARDQLLAELTRRREVPARPRVFAWGDFWAEIARRHRRPPAVLSDASARAALVAAIERARRDDRLGPLERVADLPGLRRELRSRFDAWTLADRRPDAPPPRPDEVSRAEWAIYRHYRAALSDARATDAAGLAEWASRTIDGTTFASSKEITILDPVAPSKPQRRVLDWAARSGLDVLVTLPWSGDPDDPAVGPTWESLTNEMEFEDEEVEADDGRGLTRLESTLFDAEPGLPKLGPIEGLSILGGPSGEGLGLILAREVARRIGEGMPADDILVVVPRWDDDASRAAEILSDAGIAVAGAVPGPLSADPAVAALLLAAGVAAGGWESSSIVRLLRNGAIDPDWADAGERAEAASAIRSLRVFRGREAIAAALDRDRRNPDRSRLARDTFDRLALALDGPTGAASWADQARQLLAMAERLGLESDGIDALRDAIDDHALIPDVAGRPIDRDAFVAEVEAIARDLPGPPASSRPGSVRFATIAGTEGARARVVIATNLAEGTFPSRDSVSADSTDESGLPAAYARERLAMLRLIGSAEEELILLVPTSDERGQERLAAGFVEDIRRRLGPSEDHPRYSDWSGPDPVFREHPDLAVTPADRRVAAMARACVGRRTDELMRLARDPIHRGPLEGVASALRVTHERWRVRHYTRYDGLLRDPNLVARIAKALGPDHAFSASQLESFALCPFQFYLRFVLRLDPVDDRPELRVDLASRGERLHEILEEIHVAIAAEGAEEWALGERVAAFVRARLDGPTEDDAADVASALRFLEEIDVRRALGKYAREFDAYHAEYPSRPERFEWSFGLDPERPDAEPSAPALVMGDGDGVVRLRGKIDRIDRIDDGFRVIDYKTGHAPRPIEVHTHLRAIQLPLYALAVETHLHGGSAGACDFGYWTLGRDGFAPVKLKGEAWPEFRERVVDEVVRLVGHLRAGEFPVEPKHHDCRTFCDYRTACRIGQVRDAEKEPITLRTAAEGDSRRRPMDGGST